MEKKLFDKSCITQDGRTDEPVWNEVKEYTDFRHYKPKGDAQVASVKTIFKILRSKDRV